MAEAKVFKLKNAFDKSAGEGAGRSHTIVGKRRECPCALAGALMANLGEGVGDRMRQAYDLHEEASHQFYAINCPRGVLQCQETLSRKYV